MPHICNIHVQMFVRPNVLVKRRDICISACNVYRMVTVPDNDKKYRIYLKMWSYRVEVNLRERIKRWFYPSNDYWCHKYTTVWWKCSVVIGSNDTSRIWRLNLLICLQTNLDWNAISFACGAILLCDNLRFHMDKMR